MQRCGYFFNFQINFKVYLFDFQLLVVIFDHRNPVRLYAGIYTSCIQKLSIQSSYMCVYFFTLNFFKNCIKKASELTDALIYWV